MYGNAIRELAITMANPKNKLDRKYYDYLRELMRHPGLTLDECGAYALLAIDLEKPA